MPSGISDLYRGVDDLRRGRGRDNTRPVTRAPSGAHVYNGTAIPVANVTETTLTFDTERYDTHAYHSTSVNTGRLTIPSAGRYLIIGQVAFDANATGYRAALIRLNGTTYIAQTMLPTAIAVDAAYLEVHTIWLCAAGDYVELRAYQSSGGSLNVLAVAGRSPEFMIERLA
jgi:hypothetical protein